VTKVTRSLGVSETVERKERRWSVEENSFILNFVLLK
jgi:hypothetical protein